MKNVGRSRKMVEPIYMYGGIPTPITEIDAHLRSVAAEQFPGNPERQALVVRAYFSGLLTRPEVR